MKGYLSIIPVIALIFGINFLKKDKPNLVPLNNYSHYNNDIAKKKCSFCHNDIIDYKVLHEPVLNECEKCHISTGKKHPRALFRGFKLAEKSAALCYTCHEEEQNNVVHEPIEKGKCNVCHEPHGSKYENLLTKPTSSELCAKCHNLNSSERKNVHSVIETDGCEACHDPHQSEFPNLLKVEEDKLCASCHEDINVEKQAKYIHEPFKKECSACHDPHNSKEKSLLISSSQDLCFSCHEDLKTELKKSKFTHNVGGDKFSCEKCHSPHASQNEKLLIEKENVLCFSCHNEKIKTNTKTIENIEKKIKKSKFIHKPINEKGCNSCHDPHASENQNLLTGIFPTEIYAEAKTETFELCFSCHDKRLLEKENSKTVTNFRNKDVNLHFVHINGMKGRNCNVCHDVHASNSQFLIKRKTKFGNWKMPMNFSLKENGATCKTGCHEEKEYIRNSVILKKEINKKDTLNKK